LITDAYKDAVVFGVLILVLIIRPTGIFGEKIEEKA
jgi:branched-subunit amino acid ABC-type transport system permease component